MSMLSGWVAIVAGDRSRVLGRRDLGPRPVQCRDEGGGRPFALPLVVVEPELGPDEQHTGPTIDIQQDQVVATYGKEPEPPPRPDPLDEVDELRVVIARLRTRIEALEAL